MRKVTALFIIPGVVFITLILTVLLYNSVVVLEVKEIGMDFKSTYKVMGMVTDTDAVHFGEIPVGNRGKRFANITNSYPFPIEINIKLEGEAAPFVTVDKNGFSLETGETADLAFTATVPKDTPIDRNYTGKVIVVIKRKLI